MSVLLMVVLSMSMVAQILVLFVHVVVVVIVLEAPMKVPVVMRVLVVKVGFVATVMRDGDGVCDGDGGAASVVVGSGGSGGPGDARG